MSKWVEIHEISYTDPQASTAPYNEFRRFVAHNSIKVSHHWSMGSWVWHLFGHIHTETAGSLQPFNPAVIGCWWQSKQVQFHLQGSPAPTGVSCQKGSNLQASGAPGHSACLTVAVFYSFDSEMIQWLIHQKSPCMLLGRLSPCLSLLPGLHLKWHPIQYIVNYFWSGLMGCHLEHNSGHYDDLADSKNGLFIVSRSLSHSLNANLS